MIGMALKISQPPAGAGKAGNQNTVSLAPSILSTGVMATKKFVKPGRTVDVETIEARLERKATVADTKKFDSTSLGQMTREKRHKLLYGD